MNKNIICLFGTDSKVGVTMLSQSIADYIAENNKDKKVLLIHANGEPGTVYTDASFPYCLDDIKVKLVSDVLLLDELLSVCSIKKNLYMLQGTRKIKEIKHIYPKDIGTLLAKASDYFDLIIVNAGSYIDKGICIGGLEFSNYRVLVTTQQQNSYEKFKLMSDLVAELSIDFHMLLVNKYSTEMSRYLPSEKDLQKKYEINEVEKIPMSFYSWQAESENATLLEYKERDYLKGIDRISNKILLLVENGHIVNIKKNKKESAINIFRRVKNEEQRI